MVGLADAQRSWLVGFDRIVLATGARDLALAFPGWNQPGVMGAAALEMLLSRYDAFAGRRVLILGSHDLALETALLALEHGLEVAGLVEVRSSSARLALSLPRGSQRPGIAIHCGAAVALAKGGIDGVESATLTTGETTRLRYDLRGGRAGAVDRAGRCDARPARALRQARRLCPGR